MNGQQIATHLIPGDQIFVNLVATRPNGSRLAVQAFFDHTGKEVDALGNPAPRGAQLVLAGGAGGAAGRPEFNAAAYSNLLQQGKVQAAEAMKIQYEIELAEFETQGGAASITDVIRNAVLAWASKEYDISQKDRGDGFVIKPEQVLVKNVMRAAANTPGIFAVQLTPAWG
jgi:hypothetical protein